LLERAKLTQLTVLPRRRAAKVLWAVVISVAIGVLLGFWLKWPAIVVASGIAVAACTIVLPLSHWSFLGAVLFGFALSSALQIGYLAGLLVRHGHGPGPG